MNPQFETMDDYLARLPKEEQERIRAGAAKVVEEIRLNNLRRYSDPMFVHGSLYKLDTEYLQINWMVSFQARVLMIYTPYSMPEHVTKIMELILKEDQQFKNNGIEMLGALIIDFELNICHDFAEGQKWFERKLNQNNLEVKLSKNGFVSLDEVIATLPVEQQEEIKVRSAEMVRSHFNSLPFKTARPDNLCSMSLNDDGERFHIQWTINFEEKKLLIFTPILIPSILIDFLGKLVDLDERFRQAGVSTPLDLSDLFTVHVCQEIEDRERWFQAKLYQEGENIEVSLDRFPRKSD